MMHSTGKPPPIDNFPLRPHACARGEQHPSYVLYCRIKGRRVGLYVPDELVPTIRRALDNGRALQELLYEAGRRYTNAVKHQRAHPPQAKT